jgi:hypothetical protein
MTTRRDEEKLREVADHHAADDPAVATQLYADAQVLLIDATPSLKAVGDVSAVRFRCWRAVFRGVAGGAWS